MEASLRSVAAVGLLIAWFGGAAAVAEQRFAAVAREMRQLVDQQTLPSVAVAVARDGRIVWEAAFGWADRDGRRPATPETPYSLASISKPFTATAVMTLVESGRLTLDRPANEYLRDARISGRSPERATLRRVLAHSAGLPPYFRMLTAGYPPAFSETIASRATLMRPPGQQYVYSNLGYGILDQIIEQVSGISYGEFLRRAVFEPLRLEHTFVPATAPPGAATRYAADDTVLPFYDLDHRGASSVYASARDLLRFGLFHLHGASRGREEHAAAIIGAASIREMQRVHTSITASTGYGLGWRIDDDGRGFRKVGHTGGMPGVTAVLSLFPAERVVVVVLSNKRDDRVVALADRVAAAIVPSYAWRLRQQRR